MTDGVVRNSITRVFNTFFSPFETMNSFILGSAYFDSENYHDYSIILLVYSF